MERNVALRALARPIDIAENPCRLDHRAIGLHPSVGVLVDGNFASLQ